MVMIIYVMQHVEGGLRCRNLFNRCQAEKNKKAIKTSIEHYSFVTSDCIDQLQ